MKKFLDIHSLARLNCEETENTNRPVPSNIIDLVMKKSQSKESPRLANFTTEFYQILKK